MIEILFAVALAVAVPIGVLLAIGGVQGAPREAAGIATMRGLAPEGRASRRLGAAVGAAVAGTVALIAAPLGAPFLALGIPAATVSGWWLGPGVRTTEGIAGSSLKMAAATVILADAMLMTGSAVVNFIVVDPFGGTSITNLIAGSVFLFAAGLVIVGIPMLLVTIPCGLAWAALVRRATRPQVAT